VTLPCYHRRCTAQIVTGDLIDRQSGKHDPNRGLGSRPAGVVDTVDRDDKEAAKLYRGKYKPEDIRRKWAGEELRFNE
jgi:hypothetical protein